MNKIQPPILAIAIAMILPNGNAADNTGQTNTESTTLDELEVIGNSKPPVTTHFTSPSTRITEIEAESINATSIEDFVKYEPSMVVRRRYIGDSNGVVGIRGSNMFQTARAMVFADGLPLHSLLETRWSGAPRWGLVAADETKAVEVVYGPFSAEYSGNAMGGVINIETKMPEEQEIHMEAGIFAQDFKYLGANDTYTGHREFVSYGDRFDDLGLYVFHNHLDNKGQPQSFHAGSISAPVGGETAIASGAIKTADSSGIDKIFYGDSGTAKTTTDLTKLKMDYDFGNWIGALTVAYEDRDWRTRPNTYLVDGTGASVWSGNAAFNGDRFSIGSWSGNPFGVSDHNRQTLLLGAALEGPMGNSGWIMDASFSYFDVLKDKTLSSDRNPDDPAYTTDGSVKEYDNTGWISLDLKTRTDQFLNRSDMSFVAGYHYDHSQLKVNSYDSANYLADEKTSQTTSTGGETKTHALFAQWGWEFAQQWDLSLGARYENWETINGFYYKFGGDMEDYADRSKSAFSPKFSLGFTPTELWQFRYSLAKAYRFPIVEELYKNEEKIDGTAIADAHLQPEVGLHHNLMAERQITDGFVRVNLFHEDIEDAIFNQTDVATSVSTFLPIDEVSTTGVELVIQQDGVFNSDIDMRFNIAYTDSEIVRNSADTSLEGKVFPRLPKWRANLLSTWHITPQIDTSVGLRYASNSYGQLDNSDTNSNVYGAQDAYFMVDLKTNYQVNDVAKISFGVDNVTDEVVFVHHPWPQRTFYLQGSLDF